MINIHTSISDDQFFKRSKLSPDHNNVRLSYLHGYSEEGPGPATPLYNSALLQELGGRERHLTRLYACLGNSPRMVEAILLCKVWARQREMDRVSHLTIT